MLAGCTKVGTTSETAATSGRHPWTVPGHLRIGIQSSPNTLNPLLAANTTEGMLAGLLFSVLVTTDETGKVEVPDLASKVPTLENGGISKDGLTITYALRHNVKWHDGVPFTSKDVAFTWRAIMSGTNNVLARTGYQLVQSVDTPDPYTVVFHMKQKFSPAVDTIFGESDTPYAVLPEHLLAKYPNINAIPFNSAPVGTGPFKFVDWARGDHITLAPNPDYFLGKPKLAKITIKIIPDENTELNQLRAHELDWQFEASPQEYKDLKTMSDIRLVLQDRNDYERIEINTLHPPLGDVRVRRAIAYAIDRRKLVDDLTYGSASPADQDLPPFLWAHAKDVATYPPDPAKAKALLAQAGWTPGSDGVMQKDGKRLALSMVYNVSNTTRARAVVEVQSMLRAIGIDVEIKSYLGQVLFATRGQGGVLQNGRFDLAWTGWLAGLDPDQSSIFLSTAQPPNGNNESHYVNPAMDAAEHDALTHFDRPTRIAAYKRIEDLIAHDVPTIPVWWPRQIQPVNPDFINFAPNPVTASWNAYRWEI
jgi:peptide/nickel transport system substrate-binding protein